MESCKTLNNKKTEKQQKEPGDYQEAAEVFVEKIKATMKSKTDKAKDKKILSLRKRNKNKAT